MQPHISHSAKNQLASYVVLGCQSELHALYKQLATIYVYCIQQSHHYVAIRKHSFQVSDVAFSLYIATMGSK